MMNATHWVYSFRYRLGFVPINNSTTRNDALNVRTSVDASKKNLQLEIGIQFSNRGSTLCSLSFPVFIPYAASLKTPDQLNLSLRLPCKD
ncbi:hypothetical protein L596_015164 [Steinernema carpocapsae]|uniref:Uncharacterized protein n=1 Tax=Steinernema carpocapsae TaxID=34508 RepID=A0A4U5NF49_STECR|nr:hypothetical protein L596_015164 [Steinernema carpocapsae]